MKKHCFNVGVRIPGHSLSAARLQRLAAFFYCEATATTTADSGTSSQT